jgi:hypothetical protein
VKDDELGPNQLWEALGVKDWFWLPLSEEMQVHIRLKLTPDPGGHFQWTRNLNPLESYKPQIQLAIKLLQWTISQTKDYRGLTWIFELYSTFLHYSTLYIFMLSTQPKSKLHSRQYKWGSKLSQNQRTRDSNHLHIHSPGTQLHGCRSRSRAWALSLPPPRHDST